MNDQNYSLTETRPACILITETITGYTTYVEVSKDIDSETCAFREYRGVQDVSYRLLMHPTDSLARWQGRSGAENYVSVESLDAALLECDASLERVKDSLVIGRTHPAYGIMANIAAEYIEHYKADFYYHDTLILAKTKFVPFLWSVRSTGTRFYSDNADNQVLQYDLKNNADCVYYFYNGQTFSKCLDKCSVLHAYNDGLTGKSVF